MNITNTILNNYMDFMKYFTNAIFLVMCILILGIVYFKNKEYKNSTYYKITHYSLIKACFDKGRYGEYLTYKYLKKYERDGAKFLFNVYVPKENGETSEIDVLMIHRNGIFVFESKNYSGWIFGNETQKMWTQTLPKGRGKSQKESFYNPIKQNQSHIRNLKKFLEREFPIKSVIVFSERCTLKNIQLKSDDIYVIKRDQVKQTVKKICDSMKEVALNDNDILDIYNCLYPFTQVDEETKKQHINNIMRKESVHVEINVSDKESSLEDNNFSNVENINAQEEYSEEAETSISSELESEKKENMLENCKEENQLICPRCGGILVLRTTKKGANIGRQFYGCSNYQKCRYIQKK